MIRMQVLLALAVLVAAPALAAGRLPAAKAPDAAEPPPTLEQLVTALDAAFFESFNKCDQPGQLEQHAQFLDPNLEFYHDEGGVTFTAEAYLDGVRKNVCGKFARELVPGSLKVVQLKDFGALATGTHRFCHFDTGRCEGEAEFAIVWKQDGNYWRITRVLSYGHRPLPDRPRPLPGTPGGEVAAASELAAF